MAEEKKMPEQKKADAKAETSKMDQFVSWCKALPARIAKPFKNMYYELKKVTWPTKHKWLVCSIIVLVFMIAMGIVIGLFDMGASQLVKLLGNINV